MKRISNEEIKKDIIGKFSPWWESKTESEKAWYRKFWASFEAKAKPPAQPRVYPPPGV